MSVRSMATAAVAAEAEGTTPAPPGAPPAPPGATPAPAPPAAPAASNANAAVAGALRRVAIYIPSEALATYITLVALLEPRTYPPRWIIAVVGASLVVYLVWINVATERITQQPATTKPNQWKKTVGLALLAYAVYISGVPGSPFLSISWFDLKIGGAAIIVAAVVFPGLAKRLGVAPQSE